MFIAIFSCMEPAGFCVNSFLMFFSFSVVLKGFNIVPACNQVFYMT